MPSWPNAASCISVQWVCPGSIARAPCSRTATSVEVVTVFLVDACLGVAGEAESDGGVRPLGPDAGVGALAVGVAGDPVGLVGPLDVVGAELVDHDEVLLVGRDGDEPEVD